VFVAGPSTQSLGVVTIGALVEIKKRSTELEALRSERKDMASDTDILLKEYETLRAEVIERLKTAFSHLGYFGAVAVFAFPASDKVSEPWRTVAFILAMLGAVLLLYISVINWLWVGRIATHLRELEEDINHAAGKSLLSWEHTVKEISRWVLLPPRQYRRAKVERATKRKS
jgi:hypothetical protein